MAPSPAVLAAVPSLPVAAATVPHQPLTTELTTGGAHHVPQSSN